MVSVIGPSMATPARPRASMSYLMFWPTFSIRGIGQDGPQALEHQARVEDLAMDRPANRQVIGLAGLPAEGQAHQRGAKRIEVGGLGVDAEPGLPRQLGEEAAEELGRVDDVVGWRSRSSTGAGGLGHSQLAQEPVEPALHAQGLEGGDVGLGRLQRLPVEPQGQVVAEGHQPAGPAGGLGVLAQALLLLRALDLARRSPAGYRACRTA